MISFEYLQVDHDLIGDQLNGVYFLGPGHRSILHVDETSSPPMCVTVHSRVLNMSRVHCAHRVAAWRTMAS
jgi:hypothetical protein